MTSLVDFGMMFEHSDREEPSVETPGDAVSGKKSDYVTTEKGLAAVLAGFSFQTGWFW